MRGSIWHRRRAVRHDWRETPARNCFRFELVFFLLTLLLPTSSFSKFLVSISFTLSSSGPKPEPLFILLHLLVPLPPLPPPQLTRPISNLPSPCPSTSTGHSLPIPSTPPTPHPPQIPSTPTPTLSPPTSSTSSTANSRPPPARASSDLSL